MTKPLVIYHANCDDGFGAAFAAWLKFGDEGAEYVPMNYGEDAFQLYMIDRDVYIVDFSFPIETMRQIQEYSNKLIVLDHHKTAKEALESMISRSQDHIEFDMNRSGAMMTWEFLHKIREGSPSELFLHIQDNDLWQFKNKDTKAFIRRLRSYPQNFQSWNTIHTMGYVEYKNFVNEGKAIEEFFQQQCQYAIKMGKRKITIDGVEGLGVNCTKMFSSDVGNILAAESGTFGATWMENSKGEVEFSIRSIGEFDVSAIAKKFGGGGHRNAAGFSLKPEKIIEDVCLWSTPNGQGYKD